MEKIFCLSFLILLITNSICSAATIEITDSRSTADYWINRNVNGDKILLTPQQINILNSQMLAKDKYAADLANYPLIVSADKVNALIKKAEGKYYLQSDNVSDNVTVRYAVTIDRGDIRLLPQRWDGSNYDSLQGTAIDPAEAVAVLIDSSDKKFVFVQSRSYIGWLERSKIAFTDRETWLHYIKPKDFLVVTANKKAVEINGKNILFQMGAVIPIIDPDLYDDVWNILLPTSVNGQLVEVTKKIAMYDNDINKGFLSCTENNFVRQAFKFLGDVYGWGGLQESVDCSAFTQNIYRSMGIEIPRDADRQEGVMPIAAVFNDVTTAERFDIVRRAPIGSLLFKPGHVMMYLGTDDQNKPLIIHSASSYFSGGNKIYIRKVIVSDLHYKNGAGIETINGLTGIGFYGK
ncbi:MAG: SH3 domain-containing protein [Selenomonadaceae bacterium]|nr:SH3 domain-containing protein [Selenomonadaceae bacterium]